MSEVTRKYIPMVILGAVGLFIVLSYPIDNQMLVDTKTTLSSWYMILSAFALVIGGTNIVRRNATKFTKGDIYTKICSAALIGTLFLVIILGLTSGVESTLYQYTYDILIGGGLLTFSALRSFFSFSAFYRIFKIRSIESFAMMTATTLALMYSVPIAEVFFPGVNVLTQWLQDTLQVGGIRAIYILAGIALFLVSLRMITGIDRTWLGATNE